MQPGARLQAAIDVLSEIEARGRAASVALADWGRAHRFAGSADRTWIGNLVYDSLRRKQSLSHAMGESAPRALAFSALRRAWDMPAAGIASLCTGERFCPAPLTAEEESGLQATDLTGAPPWVQGDYPEWLHGFFSQTFGAEAVAEGEALARRAPIDLRVNTLKARRDKVLSALARYQAVETPYSPLGVRLPPREGGVRGPNIEADPAHGRGWIEVQDEGSQIAALLAGAAPRMQIADICAGAGGKTLAMAAQMQNTGQIYAYDADPIRFRPIFERLKRAGVRNVQTLPPGQDGALDAFEGRLDLVLIDAPCSGTGVWRRRPDAKWRLTPAQLAARLATQRELLQRAAPLVKPGGTLAYVTCSLLPEENSRQIEGFLESHPDFAALDLAARVSGALSRPLQSRLPPESSGLLLTPARHGTDGFYIALLRRAATKP
jgi:16S rRNA (cytosine967-C5)-methyltransferase